MKRKRMILAIVLVVAVIVGGTLLIVPAPVPPGPLTVSFLGFEDALPFPGANERMRGYQAVFQVTNSIVTAVRYDIRAQGSQIGRNGSSSHGGTGELRGYSTRNFELRTSRSTNGWTFQVVISSSRPRPAWQLRVNKLCKQIGIPSVFGNLAIAYPASTNVWTMP